MVPFPKEIRKFFLHYFTIFYTFFGYYIVVFYFCSAVFESQERTAMSTPSLVTGCRGIGRRTLILRADISAPNLFP